MSIHLNAEFAFLIVLMIPVWQTKKKSIACIPKKTRTCPQKTPEQKTADMNLKLKSAAKKI